MNLGYEQLLELPFQDMFSPSETPLTKTYFDQAKEEMEKVIDTNFPPSTMFETHITDAQNKLFKQSLTRFISEYMNVANELGRGYQARDTEFQNALKTRLSNSNIVIPLLGMYRQLNAQGVLHPAMYNPKQYASEHPDKADKITDAITKNLQAGGTKILKYATIGLVTYGIIMGLIPALIKGLRK